VYSGFLPSMVALLIAGTALAESKTDANGEDTRVWLGWELAQPGDAAHRFGTYPLAVGNVWTYKNTYKSVLGGSTDIITITWTTRVLVEEHVELPEGLVVVRRLSVEDVAYDYPEGVDESALARRKANIAQPGYACYLVFKSGYFEEVPAWGWDTETRTLSEAYLERLRNPDRSDGSEIWKPALEDLIRGELPRLTDEMRVGWWRWIVEGEETVETPFGTVSDAVHLVWPALGGARHRYFKDGLGYVKEWYKHGGSFLEDEQVLVDFQRQQ